MPPTTVEIDPPDAAPPRTPAAGVEKWLDVDKPVALERLSDPRSDHHVAERAGRFIAAMLAVALALTCSVTAFNWYVDPLGEARAETTRVTVRDDVRHKLDLIDGWREAPDVLVLGSSVVMKWDPRDVERITGQDAFNAGVTGAQPKVMYAFASYVAERHPRDMPNFVLGVSHFGFHSGQDGFLREDDRLRRQLSRQQQRHWTDEVGRYADLASLHLAGSSLRVLLARATGDAAGDKAGGAAIDGDPRSYSRIDENGFLLHEYPTDPATIRQITNNHVARYRRALEGWVQAGGELNPEQVRYFERTIALANEHGHEPVVVLTQLNPEARRLLRDSELERQEQVVLDYMRDLQERLDFTLVDVRRPEAFGGSQADFYDATHVSREAAARVVELVEERGGL